MHTMTAVFLSLLFWIKTCNDYIVPPEFFAIVIYIFVQQTFGFYLHKNDYLVDFSKLPPISRNKLRYNKELFQA